MGLIKLKVTRGQDGTRAQFQGPTVKVALIQMPAEGEKCTIIGGLGRSYVIEGRLSSFYIIAPFPAQDDPNLATVDSILGAATWPQEGYGYNDCVVCPAAVNPADEKPGVNYGH